MTPFADYLQRTTGSGLTVRQYLHDAEEFCRFLEEGQPTIESVEGWVEALMGRGLRPQTIRRKLAAVRRYLGWLARQDAVARETAETLRAGYRVSPPVRERDRKPHRSLQEAEVQSLLRMAEDTEQRAFVSVLWGTGARVSEILGRRLAGIPALTGDQGKRLAQGKVIACVGKGGRRRRLVLPPSLQPAVLAWAESVPDDAPLFRMSPQTAHRRLARLSDKAGIPKVHPHAFRHGMKSRIEARGVPREVVQALLGHGPSDVTDAYGEVSDERLLQAVGG